MIALSGLTNVVGVGSGVGVSVFAELGTIVAAGVDEVIGVADGTGRVGVAVGT
jgi:hypothetical protein